MFIMNGILPKISSYLSKETQDMFLQHLFCLSTSSTPNGVRMHVPPQDDGSPTESMHISRSCFT